MVHYILFFFSKEENNVEVADEVRIEGGIECWQQPWNSHMFDLKILKNYLKWGYHTQKYSIKAKSSTSAKNIPFLEFLKNILCLKILRSLRN
jgi:hypothetical protein